MSDAAHGERAFLVGEAGPLGFAVPMDDVLRVVGGDALPEKHARLSLPRLFDGAAGAAHARFAQMKAPAGETYFEIGEDAHVRELPATAVEPIPPCLSTTARRWSWAGFVRDRDRWRVVVDVAALAPLASERGAS